jgi:chaperone modulatory protein CbpM
VITIERLVVSVGGLDPAELERWIAQEWVRPEGPPWRFRDIDVARVRLIAELRRGMAIEEEAMPVILSLLDQLYETRRQMRALCGAIEQAPEDIRQRIADLVRGDA